MHAIVVKQTHHQPRLIWDSVPDVRCGPEEVLVRVRTTAVNRADLLQARGLYPPPPGESDILGLEMAGEILKVGSRVSDWKAGNRVAALLAGGGYAQQVVVHHRMLLPLPDDWPFRMGAAVPEVWLTAFLNLFLEGGLQTGEACLIHAGASGVGTAGIQMAHEAGATVFATAGSDEKTDVCRRYGAEQAVNYRSMDFLRVIESSTDGRGVDLVLDPVGSSYLEKNLKLLKENGRLVNIGLLGGSRAEIDLAQVLGKSLRIIGSRLRSRPIHEKIAITRQFRQRFWPFLVSGKLEPVIDSVFPIQEAQSAHEHVAQNRNIGKVILKVYDDSDRKTAGCPVHPPQGEDG